MRPLESSPQVTTKLSLRHPPGNNQASGTSPTPWEMERALSQVETLAKATGARIQIFHQLEFMIPSFSQMQMPPAQAQKMMKTMWGNLRIEKEAQGKRWVRELTERGIKAKFTLGKSFLYYVEAILAFTGKFKSGIVAMTSQTKPGLSEMIGGIARRVVREAEVPVWVVHPTEISEAN